jgi:hypothetical protein
MIDPETPPALTGQWSCGPLREVSLGIMWNSSLDGGPDVGEVALEGGSHPRLGGVVRESAEQVER